MIDKIKKGHGAWPHLKTVTYHDDAVASHTEGVVGVWAQIKFVSPLWQKLKLESTLLDILDIFGSNFPPHPAKFLILHSRECLFCQILYSLSTHHCQIPDGFRGGGEGGCWCFELYGAFYKRSTQLRVCTTITSSTNTLRHIMQRNVFTANI